MISIYVISSKYVISLFNTYKAIQWVPESVYSSGFITYAPYVINLDKQTDSGTHWIALYVLDNDITYFDSFGVEHIPKEIGHFIGNKNIKTNIYRIQANNWMMCGFFCIGFIDFMLAGKTLIDYTSLFLPYEFEKNGSIVLSYSKNE